MEGALREGEGPVNMHRMLLASSGCQAPLYPGMSAAVSVCACCAVAGVPWSGYFEGADRLHLPYKDQQGQAGPGSGAGVADEPTQANGIANALQHASLE